MFSAQIRQRGEAYFRAGAVKKISMEDDGLAATVQGSKTYRVEIDETEGQIDAYCNCPYDLDQSGLCKHIWAVICALDSSAYGSPIVEKLSKRAAWADYASEQDDDAFEEDDDIVVESAGPPRRGRRTAAPSWRRITEDIRRAHHEQTTAKTNTWPPGRQIIYILSADSRETPRFPEPICHDDRCQHFDATELGTRQTKAGGTVTSPSKNSGQKSQSRYSSSECLTKRGN